MCRKTKAGLNDELIEEFPETLNDELNEQPMRSGEPMHIHLQDGARPRKTTVPRQVAKRFEHTANTTLNELIAKGVLVKEPGVTEWCSPAVGVPKGDNVRVRLCTDYRELNKLVKRPVHPFPSTREILQAIPVTAKYFAKLNAVHGYFQLALDVESSKLTTFLLPQGKFRYTRAPMGLNTSSLSLIHI